MPPFRKYRESKQLQMEKKSSFFHKNARPHTLKVMSYSPDFLLANYYLFKSPQTLNGEFFFLRRRSFLIFLQQHQLNFTSKAIKVQLKYIKIQLLFV